MARTFRFEERRTVMPHDIIPIDEVSKEHAIKGAQEELARLGMTGRVIDVRRTGIGRAVVTLEDGRAIPANGWLAVKLLHLLSPRYPRRWP